MWEMKEKREEVEEEKREKRRLGGNFVSSSDGFLPLLLSLHLPPPPPTCFILSYVLLLKVPGIEAATFDADRKADTKDSHVAVKDGYVPLVLSGKNAVKDKAPPPSLLPPLFSPPLFLPLLHLPLTGQR